MGKMPFQFDNDTQTEPLFAVLPTDENPGITAVIIADDRIGGPEDHGVDLLLTFLRGLYERATMPDLLLVYGRGVLVLDAKHPVYPVLSRLAEMDIVIKACEESIAVYNKEPTVSKIQSVPMTEITQDILRADRIIRP